MLTYGFAANFNHEWCIATKVAIEENENKNW